MHLVYICYYLLKHFKRPKLAAQEDLSNKLKAEIERRKEVCNYQKNSNLILQAEVRNAEHEIKK